MKITNLSPAQRSAIKLQLRQERLKLHKRQSERRKQITDLVSDIEKDDQRLNDIEQSLDNLENL